MLLDMSCSEFKSFLVLNIQEGKVNIIFLTFIFVLLHFGDFHSCKLFTQTPAEWAFSLSVTYRTLHTLLLLLRETIITPTPWWTTSLSLLVSENSPFENILVSTVK